MADKKPAKTAARASSGFSADERAAMKERVKELKAAARPAAGADRAAAEAEVLAKIAEMSGLDRTLGKRVHDIVTTTAPDLMARLYYGMPAYSKDGKVVCHFKCAQKFKTRYATLGFSDAAKLDEGSFWPTEFAVMELTPANEARIVELVKRAVA